MWNDPEELVVGGTGEAYVAPVGTAMPTDPVAALDPAFVGLGYHDETGVTMTITPTFTDYAAWQSRQPVRREVTKQEATVAFKLLQWNETTLPLALGGGTIKDLGGGKFKYTLPGGATSVDERALVVDVQDGAEHWRFCFFRGNQTEAVATDMKRSEQALLPITFSVLAPETDPDGPPGYFLTDSAAFAAGS